MTAVNSEFRQDVQPTAAPSFGRRLVRADMQVGAAPFNFLPSAISAFNSGMPRTISAIK